MHERDGRTVEKHGETEATEKSRNSSKPVPDFLGGIGEAKDTIKGQPYGSGDRLAILAAILSLCLLQILNPVWEFGETVIFQC
jgi:hypothetical protein